MPSLAEMLMGYLPQRPDTSGEHVLYPTASPLVNITQEDIDRGMNIAMSTGPGTIKGAIGPSLFEKVAQKYPDVKISGGGGPSGYATLDQLVVPKEMRNKGIGTQVMQDLIAEADSQGVPLALTPSSDFGGSKARLMDFYKQFGFVPNAGRNKDFTTRETMIRALMKKDGS